MTAVASRIGILGRGQLALMLEQAGRPLGQRFEFLGDPSGRVPLDVDVVTFESENWSAHDVERAAGKARVLPPTRALVTGQDRRREKELFDRLGLPTAAWTHIDGSSGLFDALELLGTPVMVKTRRGGYDGRGQWVVRTYADAQRVARELGARSAIVEELVCFERELSIVAARGADGQVAYYPLVENHHEQGSLRVTLAPARASDAQQRRARSMARAILEELDYVGVLALELFETRRADGTLALSSNEIAPRVHNSGHWTIEGAETSQFENHLRAIGGLPLGGTRALGSCAMVNLLGTLPDPRAVLAVEGAHLHVYGKEPLPGRKLGHVTLRASDERQLAQRLLELCRRIDLVLPDTLTRWTRSISSG